MIVPALPEIQRTFGGDPADATWLLTAFLLTAAVATPLLGRLGDMYGKEHWLLVLLGVFGAGSVVSALAGSLGVMIAGRAIQGAGGAIFPLAIGIIRDEFPREKVATGIGTISAMFGIGGGVGLVIAGVLVDGIGVAWIFWLSAAAALIAAWATWKYVPESPVRVEARIDWVGAVLLSGALGTLLLGVSEGNAWGWTSAGVLGLFAASVALTAIWRRVGVAGGRPARRPAPHAPPPGVDHERRRLRDRLRDVRVVRADPATRPDPDARGLRVRRVGDGERAVPAAVGARDAVRGPGERTAGDAVRLELPLALGAVFAAAGYFWLAALHDARIDIYLGSVLLGIGIGLAFAAMANLTVEAVPMNMTGIASAINAIMRQIGGAIGAQVAAAIVSAHLVSGGAFPAESGYTIAFAMSGVAAIGALFVTFVIPAREAPARAEAPAAVPSAEAAAAEAPAAEARA